MSKLLFIVFFVPLLGLSQEDEDFPPPEINTKVSEEGLVLCYIPDVASFPGGYEVMSKFLKENTKFPDSLKWDVVKVYVRFEIDTSGIVRDAKVINYSEDCEECRTEAIRVIKSMPRWIPEKRNGKPVESNFYIPIVFRNEKKEQGKIYKFVDQPAEFPGGFDEMKRFISNNVRFPNNGLCYEGNVYVRFTVRKSGVIDSVHVIGGIADLDSIAINVVLSMPNWIPGKINDKAVDSYMDILVPFNYIAKEVSSSQIIENPKQPAEYLESIQDLTKLILQNFTLSGDCIDQSKFTFRFLVSKEGRVTDLTLVDSTCSITEKAKKEIIAKIPVWKPAEDKGVKVDSYFTLPIHIRLN